MGGREGESLLERIYNKSQWFVRGFMLHILSPSLTCEEVEHTRHEMMISILGRHGLHAMFYLSLFSLVIVYDEFME